MYYKSSLKSVAFVILASILLASACQQAPASAPQVVEVVKTVEVTKVIQGETVTEYIEVTPTPEPEAPKPSGEVVIWGWPAADKAFETIIEGFFDFGLTPPPEVSAVEYIG